MTDPSQWQVLKTVPNPWGLVPTTAGGQSLQGRARAYMAELAGTQHAPDTRSRRHHYVPQAYLREWSFDERRIWTLDTVTHLVKAIGIADVCVKENFYRVVGPDGTDHNRVELLFGVVDREIRRVQQLFANLADPNTLEFDDLIGLSVSMAVQRMRTLQQRRLLLQLNRFWNSQDAERYPLIDDTSTSPDLAGFHTELLFTSMWDSADALTTRQIEIWHDPQGRFMTCDTPVLIPFERGARPDLISAPYVLWPVSPHRVVAMARDNHAGVKAIIHEANGKKIGVVRNAIEQGRERMIFATAEQRAALPVGKLFGRRTQGRIRCTKTSPSGERVEQGACGVEWTEGLANEPHVSLCSDGPHQPAPALSSYA